MAFKVYLPSSKAVPHYVKHFNVQYLEHLYDLVEEIPLNLKMTDMDSNSGEISPEQLKAIDELEVLPGEPCDEYFSSLKLEMELDMRLLDVMVFNANCGKNIDCLLLQPPSLKCLLQHNKEHLFKPIMSLWNDLNSPVTPILVEGTKECSEAKEMFEKWAMEQLDAKEGIVKIRKPLTFKKCCKKTGSYLLRSTARLF
jgi:hypothetical protein